MTASRTDSVAEAYISHDHQYHTNKDAAYVLPNDSVEHTRLELQAQHLQAIMNNNIIHSPIPTDIGADTTSAAAAPKMLDVGCGTGIVTDYIGARFPHAQVYGLDISPVPTHIRRAHPPNVHFLQGNIMSSESPLDWLQQSRPPPPTTSSAAPSTPLQSTDQFHLIFSRLLVCGMTGWPSYISKAHSLLLPDGFIELHDVSWTWYDSLSCTPDAPVSESWRWLQACKAVAKKKGMDWDCATSFPKWLEEAGFREMQVKRYAWPMGGAGQKDDVWRAWGDFVAAEMKAIAWHVIAKVLEGKGGYGEAEIRELREEMVENLAPREGSYVNMSVVTARK